MAERVQVAVVGAGPAGLAASVRLARSGAAVTLLDEGAHPGGQIYRQPPPELGSLALPLPPEGGRLLGEFAAAAPRIQYRPRTAVWGLFDAGRTLALFRNERCETVRADATILAPGALERVVPIPGWTLPGVTTVGAAQIGLKAQGLVPGRRVLVAGSGPLLPLLATQLLAAGTQVVAVLESNALPALGWRAVWLLGQPGLIRQALGHRLALVRAKVPLRVRHGVMRVLGRERVEGAIVARLDADGAPVPGSEHTVAVDALALGHGFMPNSELARLAGCEHAYDALRGGWVPRRDDYLETTLPGVFAAGDGAGIGGAAVATLEGWLAAVGALRRMGLLSLPAADAEAAPLRRRLQGMRRFQRALCRLTRPRPGELRALTAETVVCRCEEITRAEIDLALAEGVRSLDSLKRVTRAGMGFCQGRVCAPTLAALAQAVGATPEQAGWLHPRPPLRPLPLGAFAERGTGGAPAA